MATLRAVASRAPAGERAYDAHAWGLSAAWPMALMAAVLYGSLIPFNINISALSLSNGLGLLGIGLHNAPREDIITNIVVYVPIGLSLVLWGRGGAKRRLARVPFAVLAGTAVSLLAEMLQSGMVARVASWTDVTLNAIGTAVGAILGAGLFGVAVSMVGGLRSALVDRPFTTAGRLLTFGLCLYTLAPFDFAVDVHKSLLSAAGNLVTPKLSVAGEPPFTALIGMLSVTAWFALLGYVQALAGRESGRRPGTALVSAVRHGIALVLLIELAQLFTRSHSFEPVVVMLGSLAVAAGAWWAIFVVDLPIGSAWKQRPGLAMPTVMLVILGVFQVVLLLAGSIDQNFVLTGPVDRAAIQWVPFEAMWHRPMTNASAEIGSIFVTYGTLALTLAILLRRARTQRAWLVTGVGVTLAAFGLEGLQTLTATRTADLTTPVLALVAAVLVARVYPALRTDAAPAAHVARHSRHHPVDEPSLAH